ncbi:MAG: outer membrane lipoprotein carrier protein LolA, partial [Deltaproteobacteria bacterium]|nr:outer membrane lipoprotein carrier protein LolA [Deltaproteobacteria bacterium]
SPFNKPLLAETVTLEQLIAKIQKAYDETVDFTAVFKQKAMMKSINKTVTEEGTLHLKKPQMMFWDYTKPALKKLVLNPQKAWLYMPEENTVYVQDAESLLSSKITIRFLTGIGNLQEDFAIAFSKPDYRNGKGDYLITLKPNTYEAGVKRLLLTINRDSYYIAGCTFVDMYENRTELTFTDVVINKGIPDTLFTFVPPEDAEVYNIP